MAFTAPIDAADWTLTTPGPLTIPAGLRYAGVRLPELGATRASGGPVRMPALGMLRSIPDGGRVFVEVQLNPFPIRDVVRAVPFGLPTFYLVFDSAVDVVPFDDGDTASEGETLAPVTEVGILCAGQDRVARDPALWSQQIANAIDAGAPGSWQGFAAEVHAQTTAGPDPPILVLDHTGAPLTTGAVEITSGPTTATAVLTESDGGDLQRAVARMHAGDPPAMPLASVFQNGPSATLRALPTTGTDFQLSALEEEQFAEKALEVTALRRHVALTDLMDWFAPQFATPEGSDQLARYTRGNVLRPFVNGTPYFDDLFHRLREAATAGATGGLHLVGGWKTFPEEKLTAKVDGMPDLPRTLKEAAESLGENGGSTRFLSPQFIQLDPGSPVERAELIVVSALLGLLIGGAKFNLIRSDFGGVVILLLLLGLNAKYIPEIIDSDGRFLEPNKDMLEVFASIPRAESVFAPYPATVADNPANPPLTGFPYDQLIKLIRHFGFYHQKFAIVRADSQRYGYAGGCDINPNRLDDARHIQAGPYHDVHAKVQGQAVRDIELSFQQRWAREVDTALAFDPAPAADYDASGQDVVQVARTYFKSADPARRLKFAPEGDKTILETLLRAIDGAREFIYIEDQYYTPPTAYRTALLRKVEQREIGSLVIALPSSPDQPFGETPRYGFIEELRQKDAGAGIVRVGYPRRHYTVASNELRASSGKLLLMADLGASGGINPTVALGPKSRLPQPPFWLAVEGELMYAFDESTTPSPDAEHALVYQVLRGVDTRMLKGGSAPAGPRMREHKAGAAATVVRLSGIYVHAKMMIVDDVFVSIGSANINRRGLLHDGEINLFGVPEQLKASPANKIAALRRELWAEMLNLPLGTAAPLLDDPIAAARLFDRSPLQGNRFTDIDALPARLMYNATGGDGLVLDLLRLLLVDQFLLLDSAKIFDAVIDPTSAVETA